VPGVGNEDARIALLGEGPGQENNRHFRLQARHRHFTTNSMARIFDVRGVTETMFTYDTGQVSAGPTQAIHHRITSLSPVL